jgi:NADH:ubiquinone oxidoreductase subunit H
MTLWLELVNTITTSLPLLSSSKIDYASLLLSDANIISLTSWYYKIQYLIDYLYILASSIYNSLFFSANLVSFNAFIIALKFLLLIALLIFIRGGLPRYRFDHLTKIGWIKYLSLVLASILIQFLLLWMF